MILSLYLRSIDVVELSFMAALPPDFTRDWQARIIFYPKEMRLINLLRTEGLGLWAADHDY